MSFFQRIQNEEQNKKIEAEDLKRKQNEIIRTHPKRYECEKLIPIVDSLLKDLSDTYGYIIEKESEGKIGKDATSTTLYKFYVYKTRKKYLMFAEKTSLLLRIEIGRIFVDDKLQTRVFSIFIIHNAPTTGSYGVSSYEDHTLATHEITKLELNVQEEQKWIEEIFYRNKELFKVQK